MKKLINAIKLKINNALEKMARANQEYFKGEKPSCCGLNKTENKK